VHSRCGLVLRLVPKLYCHGAIEEHFAVAAEVEVSFDVSQSEIIPARHVARVSTSFELFPTLLCLPPNQHCAVPAFETVHVLLARMSGHVELFSRRLYDMQEISREVR
jgi:hypothetical protein